MVKAVWWLKAMAAAASGHGSTVIAVQVMC